MSCRPAALLGALLLVLDPGLAEAQTYRERGAYLVNAVAACGHCHTPAGHDGKPLAGKEEAGGREFDIAAGQAVASNITPDAETGIGGWRLGQIVYALRNGKRPDGSVIGPPMPIGYYRSISDRDAGAIAAYLKSLKPVRNAVPRSQYRVTLPADYGPPVAHVAEPDRADPIAYGGYLAGPVAHCLECHTPRPGGQLDSDRLGAGGRDFPDFGNPGGLTVSRNITPDPVSGIGRWSDADVKAAILLGIRPDGTRLSPTMPSAAYRDMTSDDVNAITFYLRSLRPVP